MAADRKALAYQAAQEYRWRTHSQGVPSSQDVEDLIFHILESWDTVIADATLSNVIDRRVAAGHATPYTRPEPLED
ncbi:hypothetical protein HUN42_00085 [Streptomyces phage Dagobah]|nr:hypothetical protein HUN42_00085 [Streptomyces phage Dagobah]